MTTLLTFLGNYMNAIIIGFGIVMTVVIVLNAVKLAGQKNRIWDAMNRKNMQGQIHRSTLAVSEHEESENVTPETVRHYETEFNKVCSAYNVYTQLIPLFPLFGILGTVAGLVLQVNAKDISVMFSSLGLALESTLWGLIFAIALKALVAFTSSRIINDVEIMLDDYDKKFNNLLAQQKISEE